MAGNKVNVEFAGDARKLQRAAGHAGRELDGFSAKAKKASAGLSTMTVAAAGLGPALLPVLAAGTTAAIGLGAALGGAGAALGVFGAVAKSAFGEVKEASTKTQELRDKIALLTEQAKVAERTGLADAGKIEKARDKAVTELIARYNQLPPAVRKAAMAYDGMKASWQKFVDANKPAVYDVMTRGTTLIGDNLGKLQPLFDVGAAAAGRALAALERFAAGGGVERLVGFLSSQAGPALESVGTIASNVATFFGNLFAGTAADGQKLLEWLAEGSEKLAAWSAGDGLTEFLTFVRDNGEQSGKLLADIAVAAANIAVAVTPLAPVTLAVAGALAAMIAAVPPDVLTAVVAAWVAYGAAVKVWAVYQAIATGVQWLWNAALLANPITWIIIAVVALIAVIVLIATKTDWFQKAWSASWKWIKNAASNVWDWLKKVPGWIGTAFAKVAKFITLPFRTAFNFVADAWNNTIGSLSWAVPGWIPGIGGNTISVPHIPKFHSGGTVPGAPGSEMLAVLQAGETVTPAGAAGGGVVYIRGDGVIDAIIEAVAERVGRRGGDPGVLGIRV